ncbi:hypothetical protein Hypma_005332 [Hypsizygus marmoreus]|uniref:Dynamin N-terminal domain-containing protein n=1 Tax=Hypsizygus marmoreus TaxID=39966 RepID=A0A369K4Q7_HYPMA|nr:hypothetical protein Hypma_005332 [Hypsizygus marmoreus]
MSTAGARKIVWQRDLDECRRPPVFTVTFMGSTGAGKSSLINALLEVEVVPTSGSRACTSVVTEISYHEKAECEASIEFLTEDAWWKELAAVVGDMKEDIEEQLARVNSKTRTTRPTLKVSKHVQKSWNTLRAVYPHLTLQQVAHNPTTQLIDSLRDRDLWPTLKDLGSSKHICKGRLYQDGGPFLYYPAHYTCRRCSDYIRPSGNIETTAKTVVLSLAYRNEDGTFKSSKLTFVVTKCDDIAWEEVAKSMQLEDDPDFIELQDKVDECRQNIIDAEAKYEEVLNTREFYEEKPHIPCAASPSLSQCVKAEEMHVDDVSRKRLLSDVKEAPDVKPQYALRTFCSQQRSEETSMALLEKVMEEMEDDFGDTAEMFPVFTVATRDYQKINRRMSGEMTCFLDVDDTKIPALRDHCRLLACRVREEFALTSFEILSRTTSSMYRVFEGIERADDQDMQLLSTIWGEQHGRMRSGSKSLEERVRTNFIASRNKTIEALKEHFNHGLEETCIAAAEEAITEAVPTALKLQQEVSWQRLRAILRVSAVELQWTCNGAAVSPRAPRSQSITISWRDLCNFSMVARRSHLS